MTKVARTSAGAGATSRKTGEQESFPRGRLPEVQRSLAPSILEIQVTAAADIHAC